MRISPLNSHAIFYLACLTLSLLAILISPNQKSRAESHERELYYGMFEDAGMVHNDAVFAEMIEDLQSRNMNAIMFSNNTPNLTVSDQYGMHIVAAPMGELHNTWFYNDQVEVSIESARAIVGPVIDSLSNHSSLVGYNLIDDATPQNKEKIRLAVQVAREQDPHNPASPMMIRHSLGQEVYAHSRPDAFLMYYYPARNKTAPCDFYAYSATDWIETIRMTSQQRPPGAPLWLVLQTHSTITGPDDPDLSHLRVPTVEEIRLQNWLSLGEGADGIFWFLYSTLSDQPWTGIKDDPVIYAEITQLASRVNELRPILTHVEKVSDRFYGQDASTTYASSLIDFANGKQYVLVANTTCGATDISLSSFVYEDAQLKDVETGEVFALGDPIAFRGGDGRMFEVISSQLLPAPLIPAANLVQNASFEQSEAGQGGPISGWNVYGTALKDNQQAYSGSASVQVSGGGNTVITQNLELEPNTEYYLSYWTRGQSFNESNLGMRFVKTNGDVAFIGVTGWKLGGSFGWEKRIAYFRTPSDLTTGRLDIYWTDFAQNTIGWVDDVVLCKVGTVCADSYLSELAPSLFTSIAPPTDLILQDQALDTVPVFPVMLWRHDLGTETGTVPAQYYQVQIFSGEQKIIDRWTPAATACSGVECSFSIDSSHMPGGLLNGMYRWKVRGWVVDQVYSEWSAEAEFIVNADSPVYDGALSVSAPSGYVVINWPVDPQMEWMHVKIDTLNGMTAYKKWHNISSACGTEECQLIFETNLDEGEYLLSFQGWGADAGFLAGDANVWFTPYAFSVVIPIPGKVEGLEQTVTGQSQTQFHWSHSDGASWYEIRVVRQADGAAVKSGWNKAVNAGCLADTSCTWPEVVYLGGGTYNWQVRGWGPGGMGQWSNLRTFDLEQAPGVAGVPAEVLNYTGTAEAWWATHPYNPESVAGNFVEVGQVISPQAVANVCQFKAGSTTAGIAEALATLPASGGTLFFPAECSPYVMTNGLNWTTNQYKSDFNWVGNGVNLNILRRSNLHFVSDTGVRIVGSFHITSMSYRDGHGFDEPVRNFYFKNLTFEARQNLGLAFIFEDAEDILFDNVTFDRAGVLSIINSNNLWIRDSQVIGGPGIHYDGTHGAGIINTSFEGGVGNRNVYGVKAMVDFHVNNDGTADHNNSGTLDAFEMRQPRYFVFQDNLVSTNDSRLDLLVGGVADVLITDNQLFGSFRYILNVVGDSRPIPGLNQWYSYYNYDLRGNVVYAPEALLRLSPAENFRIGKFSITQNAITNGLNLVAPGTGPHDGPQVIEANCINGNLQGTGEVCVAPAPIPVELSVSGNLAQNPASPSFSWRHQTDFGQTQVSGSLYRVIVKSPGGKTVLDAQYNAPDICTGLTCSIQPEGIAAQYLSSGTYKWWVGALTGQNTWYWSGGPALVASTFVIAVPHAALPTSIIVDEGQGRPVISWADDPDTLWVQLWIGPNQTTGAYQIWLRKGGEGTNGYQCSASTCTFAPNINWTSGGNPYQVWMRAWGPGGFSLGGTSGWAQGEDMVLPDVAAGLATDLLVNNTGSPNPQFVWNAGAFATWYHVIIEPIDGSWSWSAGWHPAEKLGCVQPGTTCTLENTGLNGGLLPNGMYILKVRSWGPGGFSEDPNDGDQFADTTFQYSGAANN